VLTASIATLGGKRVEKLNGVRLNPETVSLMQAIRRVVPVIDGSFLTFCDCLLLMGLSLAECVCYWVFF